MDLIKQKRKLEDLAGEIADMDYSKFTEGEDYAALAKRYQTSGKKAMDDTMGMAAARTGGLASSYAVAAGNQAYNDHMSKLEDAARALYENERAEKKDNFSIAQGMYDRDYGEKQDYIKHNQWERSFTHTVEQDNISNDLLQEELDISKTSKEEADLYNELRVNPNTYSSFEVYKACNPDTMLTAGDFFRIMRTAAGNYAEDNREYTDNQAIAAQEDAREQVEMILSQRGTPPENLIKATGWDNATIEAIKSSYEAKAILETEPFEKAIFLRTDDEDSFVYSKGGKEVTMRAGANPYTGSINKDLLDKDGKYDPSKAWGNTPYQPNNVASEYEGDYEKGKLSKTGRYAYVNGVKQNVWETPDGETWIWDGTENIYIKEKDITYED